MFVAASREDGYLCSNIGDSGRKEMDDSSSGVHPLGICCTIAVDQRKEVEEREREAAVPEKL